ncbi:hypothetical protein LSTR_LSTR001400, partial [Laodelphax striatellus]
MIVSLLLVIFKCILAALLIIAMQSFTLKFGDSRNDWKCCFCCHVRTGTIFLGIWHLVIADLYMLMMSFCYAGVVLHVLDQYKALNRMMVERLWLGTQEGQHLSNSARKGVLY